MRWLAKLLFLLLSTPVNLASSFSKWGRDALSPLRWRLDFRPRPGDVYIATYPKCGTTWLQMILVQLVNEGRGEFGHISQVSPYLEELSLKARLGHLERLPSPRLMKTHMLYEHLRPAKSSRIILVTRDVRDALISHYHHHQLATRFLMDFDAFMGASLRSDGNADWFAYMRSWLPHRHDDNVLWVRYEDLRDDLEAQVRRIAAFCGIPLREERLGDILHKCSFAYMKQHEMKFDFRLSMYEQPEGGFIRKGGSGGERQRIREEHSAELTRRLERLRDELRLKDSERI
ncbi:sulfotransferase domain-containing protein [Myxococcus eversor]|uniref:sulfotransferase domain-containing protein n=1 Tax=Myxococcus eversor TaxID=2709661 RepID=UPI0013D06C80|nr:sulfotransferase domain-containing protein [Myxococcus eversor]